MSLEGKTTEEIEALATLADSVLSNPKTRTRFQRVLREANPNISAPEIELEDRLVAATKPLVDKIAQNEAREAQREAQQQGNKLYEDLHDDRVVASRKDFEALVIYASEKGFVTNDAGLRMAASHRASELEPAEPTPMPGAIDLSKREAHKGLFADPKGWAAGTAAAAIDELNSSKRGNRAA